MNYIEVRIVQTATDINGQSDEWQTLEHETKTFHNLAEAHEYLNDRYKKAEKEAQYADDPVTGKEIQCGWTYSFENRDWSHYSEPWWQCDWVTVHEVESKLVLV
jgi:hypothetical protein